MISDQDASPCRTTLSVVIPSSSTARRTPSSPSRPTTLARKYSAFSCGATSSSRLTVLLSTVGSCTVTTISTPSQAWLVPSLSTRPMTANGTTTRSAKPFGTSAASRCPTAAALTTGRHRAALTPTPADRQPTHSRKHMWWLLVPSYTWHANKNRAKPSG